MAFREIRDVPCPVCGAGVGKPCLLRSGKPLEEVHCTDRISAAAGIEPMTTPSVPYVPGRAAPALKAPQPEPAHHEAPPAPAGVSNARDESPGDAPAPAPPSSRRGEATGEVDTADRLQPVLF